MSLLGNEQIIQTLLEDEMRSSYLDYSMSVIVSRALPDVRDGLKPVHRRILFAMQELGLLPNKAHKKSARLVGEVLGKYHPHGDSSVYDAMVRLGQEWNMRYTLVDGQGNFGSIDGDPPAAMRYTETRLAQIAMLTLKDIDKNTVEFQYNFDESLKEPTVLPSVLPTLLLNGASGIAVGMATNIPPHNLGEIINGLHAIIENPELTEDELMKIVPAPDFPTGGIIYGYSGVRDCYLTGRGKIILRAKVSVEENKTRTKQTLVVTELPYQVNKSTLIEKIADLVRSKQIEDISGLNDESDREGMRIVIDLKRDAIAEVVLNNLFKHSQLQVTFGANMLSLVNGRPRVLTLKKMMAYFLKHRNDVIVRRTKFELDAAEKRAHILEGFIIALDNIEEVIKTIRASADVHIASAALQEKFTLSEIQAKSILEMRLQRLTGLEREKILKEYRELLQTIERLKSILASKELQMQIIFQELKEIKDKFNDPRRTEIVLDGRDFTLEDMIANEEMIITITHKGYIKRTSVSTYRRQNKGGRGLIGTGSYDDDYVEFIFQASTHHFLLAFTDFGRVFKIKVYDIPEGSRTAKGRSINNVIAKMPNEKVSVFRSVKEFKDDEYVVMCTEMGTIKKTELSNFASVRSTGIIAINLSEGDRLISTQITDGSYDIIIGTREGLACRFRESDVRSMGRAAAGVIGINLSNTDKVISMMAIKRQDTQVIVVSERGYGKRTKYEEFRLTKRGAKGVISMNLTEKTGKVVAIIPAVDSDDLVVMTSKGILIRQGMKEIRTIGRNTQGVRLIRLDEGDYIADITSVEHEEIEINDSDEPSVVNEGLQEQLL